MKAILGFFDHMFSSKKVPPGTGNLWDQLTKDVDLIGYHIFIAKRYVDYGYGRYPTNYLGALEYQGSTTDKDLVERLALTEPHIVDDHFVVMHGKLMDVKPIKETYSETITKEKVVGYKLVER